MVKFSVGGLGMRYIKDSPHKYRSTNVYVSVFQSMLAPPGHRPRVCSVVFCVSRDASCVCCDVACRDWSATGASAAQTPPVSLQATSSACSQSDTLPEVTTSQAG